MHAARANGLIVHFADEGDRGGLPVVFVNSLGTDFRIWDRMAAVLPAHLRLIRYDKRGHGLSECPAGTWRIEDLADDLAALLDKLEVSRAVIVGLSIGGQIAQSLAVRRPDLVRAMVLMDTAAKIGDASLWDGRIAQVREKGIEAIADGVMARWFSKGFREHRRTELAVWRNMLNRTPAAGYIGCSHALREADLRESTVRISAPVLAMVGDEDGSTPPDLVEATADLIAGAQFQVVREAGHLPNIEHPATCAAMILSFLREHDID